MNFDMKRMFVCLFEYNISHLEIFEYDYGHASSILLHDRFNGDEVKAKNSHLDKNAIYATY
jgi:hypothetical protein